MIILYNIVLYFIAVTHQIETQLGMPAYWCIARHKVKATQFREINYLAVQNSDVFVAQFLYTAACGPAMPGDKRPV
jgi:hypothetical protein